MDANDGSKSCLSEKATRILRLIADGCTYNQIAARLPGLTCEDIFNAAGEALRLAESSARAEQHPANEEREPIPPVQRAEAAPPRAVPNYHERLAEIKAKYPRAYTPWPAEEDEQLGNLAKAGTPVSQIAAQLQRQPSAIRSRLVRLNLTANVAVGGSKPDTADLRIPCSGGATRGCEPPEF